MRAKSLLLLPAVAVAAALASCGGEKQAGHAHDEGGEHGDHHEEGAARRAGTGEPRAAHPADPQTVRIAPEMIRDLRVTIAKAEARAAGERVSVLAELRVNQDAYAEVASPAPARVSRVLARAGDEVVANQPLVELASGDMAKARAEIAAADARAAIARKNLERKQALLAERLIAEREVLEAQAALAEAEAARTVAAGALRQFAGAEGGSGLVLRAPVAGTVIQREVALGQLVDPSKTLFRIGDLSTLWLIAHVFERDAVRVQTGGHGTATFAALPGKTVEGKITWIGREVETASRTVPVRLEVKNPDGVLRPGMSATVSIPVGASGGQIVSVPIAAVQRVDDKWAAFVPRGPGAFEVRPIGRGRDLGGEVEILSGLSPGDEVVVDGAFLLKAEFDKSRGEGGHDHHH
ncbi:MAG TPA: efflux RND transporter periplasmic adaptor subunit [Kofleriaceae bacterium]|nr:efflux RND transporter periplasmic adaptor subunit [Kofleriaceae bacterium]